MITRLLRAWWALGLAGIIGIVAGLGILAILSVLLAGCWPKETDPRFDTPSTTPTPKYKTAQQEAPR